MFDDRANGLVQDSSKFALPRLGRRGSTLPWLPDAAYKPLTGDDKETARYFAKRNKAEREGQGSLDFARGGGRLPAAAPLANEARALRAMPEDSPEEIAAKRRRFAAGRADPKSWSLQIAADLYTARSWCRKPAACRPTVTR